MEDSNLHCGGNGWRMGTRKQNTSNFDRSSKWSLTVMSEKVSWVTSPSKFLMQNVIQWWQQFLYGKWSQWTAYKRYSLFEARQCIIFGLEGEFVQVPLPMDLILYWRKERWLDISMMLSREATIWLYTVSHFCNTDTIAIHKWLATQSRKERAKATTPVPPRT